MRKYQWRPDLPDKRDLIFDPAIKYKDLPASVDLSTECSKVEDQGDLGSCTANALAGNIEFLAKKPGGVTSRFQASRLFIYWNERNLEGTVREDSGAYIRDGIKTLKTWGVCGETLWPYHIQNFTDQPPHKCYEQASKYRINSYMRIRSGDQTGMLQCLAEGFPFVFGFSVYESFESEDVTKTGIVPMPGSYETLLGGHAVLAVGYDQEKELFKVRNSWGEDWGDKGHFYMPFQYLSNPDLSDDFWTIRK